MSRSAIIPLVSQQLAELALPVPCFLCGATNMRKAERCTHCSAPMALAPQADNRKTILHLVAALGPTGVGKSVYLGILLDMLSRQPKQYQTLARGASTINLQQNAIRALARHEFPTPTPVDPEHWDWIHCQIDRSDRKVPLELVMPDMAGDAVMRETDHPHSHPAVRLLLTKASGALVFIDAFQAQQGSLGQDFTALKILACLGEIDSHRKRGWPARPVALVFTKADLCEECFDDPSAYAESHLPELWRQCRQRFRRHRFFATGIVGACAHRSQPTVAVTYAPLRIEPHGVVEPFEWMLESLSP